MLQVIAMGFLKENNSIKLEAPRNVDYQTEVSTTSSKNMQSTLIFLSSSWLRFLKKKVFKLKD